MNGCQKRLSRKINKMLYMKVSDINIMLNGYSYKIKNPKQFKNELTIICIKNLIDLR